MSAGLTALPLGMFSAGTATTLIGSFSSRWHGSEHGGAAAMSNFVRLF